MGVINKYRVWFEAYHYTLGFYTGAPGNQINIEGMTKEGVPIEAYTAADALEQAKLEIPYLIRELPGGPYQTAIYRIAPDRSRPENESPDPLCMHFPPCRGKCVGDPGPSEGKPGVDRKSPVETPIMHMPDCDGHCDGTCISSATSG